MDSSSESELVVQMSSPSGYSSSKKKKKLWCCCMSSQNQKHYVRICAVKGVMLLLVGMASSNSENLRIVDMAERTLENLEKCENIVRQTAETGRLQPLLQKLLLEG